MSDGNSFPPIVKPEEQAVLNKKPISPENLLHSVPEPHLPERPDLTYLYRRSWILGLLKSRTAHDGSGFIPWYIDDAFDNRYFQWDICFSIAWAKYSGGVMPEIECLDNFYQNQHEDGAICGVLRQKTGEDDLNKSSPYFTRNNLFSWIEYEYYLTTGDKSRFERVVPILSDYARWIRKNRRRNNGHFYGSGYSSGMDNSPRSTAESTYPPFSWVDIDANEALAALFLEQMAAELGDLETAIKFKSFHTKMKHLVNSEMWSEKDSFYWDLDRDGTFLKQKTIASFWPLWAGICEERHVNGLVTHLNNEDEFKRPHRVPVLSRDHPKYSPEGNYWCGSIWPPTNHMIVKGLARHKRNKLAREIVINHLNQLSSVWQSTNTVWENYAPEKKAPGTPSKPDFVGWSALGPIAQLIEFYIGLRLRVPEGNIIWHLLTTEELGIKNLPFGNQKLTLIAENRSQPEDPVTIRTRVEQPIKLILKTQTGSVEKTIHPDTHRIKLTPGTKANN